MSERGHALDAFLRDAAATERSTVTVKVMPGHDMLNLRGDASDTRFAAAVHTVLRQDLPLEPNTVSAGMSTVYWLGPDEWLIVSPGGERPTLPTLLEEALNGMSASLNVVTGGYVGMHLSGGNAADVLAKGCTLDLHQSVFQNGQCAQTGLARASILLARTDDAPSFDIYVRRSFAEYLALWLQNAGTEYGIRFEG